jgi:hypothetical protein
VLDQRLLRKPGEGARDVGLLGDVLRGLEGRVQAGVGGLPQALDHHRSAENSGEQAGTITRVARWFVFKPKIRIWVNFVGSWYGKYWYIFDHLVYFTGIGNILWPFGVFCVVIWYIFPRFGILDQEKSGNPGRVVECALKE